ncbi:MAG: hypothetical protein Q9159_006898 [Coniocarpon cinnabarinum]
MSQTSILVVGGCGFLGYHIVRALVQTEQWSAIHVMSRNPTRNRHQNVQYHAANLSSPTNVQRVISEVRPVAIVHCASPGALPLHPEEVQETDVDGTQNLLKCVASTQSVRAFVYTSTTDVIARSSYSMISEDTPTWTSFSRVKPYAIAKATAERLVTRFNSPGKFHTVSLRMPTMYGDRDNKTISSALRSFENGKHTIQIGDNQNLYDTLSASNAAMSHVCALNVLLGPMDGVKHAMGQAFFITDGKPVPFWDFQRQIYSAAGDTTRPDDIKVIPAWLMLNLADCIEWCYWIFTLGSKTPPKNLTRYILEYACLERTVCINRARDLLGFAPVDDRDEQIRQGIEYYRVVKENSGKEAEARKKSI